MKQIEAAKVTGHTAGPWVYRKQAASPVGTRDLYGVGPIRDGAVWFAAENVSESDARLIAAAPDLLAALKMLRETATSAYQYGRVDALAFVEAGNVIAKAEAK